MALSKDDILNAIAEMTVMDVVDLIKAMEDKFGVTAAAAVAVAAPAAAAPAAAALLPAPAATCNPSTPPRSARKRCSASLCCPSASHTHTAIS